MKRIILVANSSSGSSDAEVLDRVTERLTSLGPVDRVEPGGVDSFGDDIRGALDGGEGLIVAAGGDGTMNCTINGFDGDFEGRTFALIPMGTGNDLARTLGIDPDPVAAAQPIVEGTDKDLDVSRASGSSINRLFINACMGGFPVKVNQAIEDDVKKRLGPLAFGLVGRKPRPISRVGRFK